MLEAPVVIRASRDTNIEIMRMMIRKKEMIRRSFRGGISARWFEARGSCELSQPFYRAIDFVRGYLHESLDPIAASGFEQRNGAQYIRFDERQRQGDRAINMAFCREINDGIEWVPIDSFSEHDV